MKTVLVLLIIFICSSSVQMHKSSIIDISRDFSSSHFYSENYTCFNFSSDLKKELQNDGYDARIVFGRVDCSAGFDCDGYGNHAWVEVENIWIEPQTGEIIPSNTKVYGV